MNEQDLQYFKAKLEKNLKELSEKFASMGRQLNDDGDWIVIPEPIDDETPEYDEVASKTENFESDIAVLNVLEQRYTDIQEALKRIDDGTYGVCGDHLIARDRLEANPVATACIEHTESH